MPAGFSCGHCSKVILGEDEDKVYHSAKEHIEEHGLEKKEDEIRDHIEEVDEKDVDGDVEHLDR
ncbi:MAG: hypothetical protein ABEJ36_02435 [Candidatus Nanosalina sp.]